MGTTDRRTVVQATRSALGYRTLTLGGGEAHGVREELLTGSGASSPGDALLTVGHLSDLHLCDSQSPARAEFLDRWADDDSPVKHLVQDVGTYRAQDSLTVQVAEAMVRSLNAVGAGPVGGAALDWTIVTGDVLDNAQRNELGWYLGVLDGGPVLPDSGDPERYEGVSDAEEAYWDEAFWHPEPSATGLVDRPRRLHGFPDAPGLLQALRLPFDAVGLAMPWLAVHGNHDQMIQGTIPALGPFADAGSAASKVIGLPEGWTDEQVARFCRDLDTCELDALTLWARLPARPVTPDLARAAITRAAFIDAHFHLGARPSGHGFAHASRESGEAYYRYDHGRVTVLTLDSVNEHGGWQGSLDRPQFAWLIEELTAADREGRYAVLASHHPLRTFVNGRGPGARGVESTPSPDRVLAAELDAELARHPSLVLWLNGHTHTSTVTPHPGVDAAHSWWEVTTPSLIDYPQQGRIVELLRGLDGTLTIACTMLDHDGELPWSGAVDSIAAIAGLSRELAANDWQRRVSELSRHPRVGVAADRNVLLRLADPHSMPRSPISFSAGRAASRTAAATALGTDGSNTDGTM